MQSEISLQRSARVGFEAVRQLAREAFGLDLRPGKEALVEARLGRVMRSTGCASLEEYCRHVRQDSSGQAHVAAI